MGCCANDDDHDVDDDDDLAQSFLEWEMFEIK